MSGAPDTTEPADPPHSGPLMLRVVKGNPTDEELAAVVTLLALSAIPAPKAIPAPTTNPGPIDARAAAGTGQWSAYWRGVGAPMPSGPDAWRQSARP
ncbi:MAG TPA: acyl-CoA carboxylase subunit epsilon [Microlunatus sp.]|nr:acyl-CoA carboxylase subunit epsilon [Microlunatus sp.]